MLQAVELTIRLHPDDDVVIARMELATGTLVTRENVRTAVTIPPGHKLAVRDIAQGRPVRRYNQIIGFATRDIKAGGMCTYITSPWATSSETMLFVPCKNPLSTFRRAPPSRASCAPTDEWRRETTSAS